MVHELVEGLLERGHEVTLFATGDSQTAADLRSLYPVAEWPPHMLADVNHVSWAMAQIAAEEYDVIHAHSMVALAVSRLVPQVPLVYTIHHERDDALSAYYQHFPEAFFIAISRDQLRREAPLPRTEVIHHGLSPWLYQCTDVASDYLCFIGRFARVKGPHIAIDVAGRAGLPIHLAGEIHPPDRSFARAEMEPRLALPHVTFLGSVDAGMKVPLLRDARALVAPIQWNEPFGLILIEAMLSGCPVVAFRRGSAPELIEPGVTGFLADTEDEMVELVRPGGPLDRFDRARCRRTAVAQFSRDRMVRDHERLYMRVIDEAAEPRGSEPALAV